MRTEWNGSDIWLRREFDLPVRSGANLRLLLHHDEDAEVYINGVLAAKVAGYTRDCEEFAISGEARASFKAKSNVLAVHCHQTGGGQYIDTGLVNVVAK